MAYYNTTNQKAVKLTKFEQKTETQEQTILNIFRHSKTGLTASEVFTRYRAKNTPLTSIRRGITNLMNDNKLVKTHRKREGIYGRPETEYQLYTGQMNLFN